MAGASLVLSFAPFGYWPLSMISLMVFYWLIYQQPVRVQIYLHYAFALGLFGFGITWIYVSIHTYGGADKSLAIAMTGLFVLFWSLTFVPQGWLLGHIQKSQILPQLPWFAMTFVLGEWLRGWFLTGFPWLYVGYAHSDTWIGSWAPIGGVLLISFVVVAAAEILTKILLQRQRLPVVALTGLILATLALNNIKFVSPDGALTMAGIQANLNQHTKWQAGQFDANLTAHLQLMADLPRVDLVIWSEASFTRFQDLASAELSALDEAMEASQQGLIIGLPSRDEQGYYNGALGLGLAEGGYRKRHLVPFGEYVPLASWLRGTIQFFDLPMSFNQSGPAKQPSIVFRDRALSLSICYEVAYPELVRQTADEFSVLVTVSNDTWFGDSSGPFQHLQIAQMRARELGRSLFRVTNNGITALVTPDGVVERQLPKNVADVLVAEVPLYRGRTPYGRVGQWPLLVLIGSGLLAFVYLKVKTQSLVSRRSRP